MSAVEFEVAGFKYRSNQMDARRQFHVATKLAGMASAFTTGEGAAGGVAAALMTLSPEDSDFVINHCLLTVERLDEASTRWAPIMTPQGQFLFDDIRTSLATVIQLIAPVIEANAKGFLSEIPNDFLQKLMAKVAPSS